MFSLPKVIGAAGREPALWKRVWSKVDFPAPGFPFDHPANVVGCWNWLGACSLKRRGQRRPHIQLGKRGSRVVLVARLICERFHGPPPSPFHEAGHTCPEGENALCVNPSHLEWMTRVENEQHKIQARRADTS